MSVSAIHPELSSQKIDKKSVQEAPRWSSDAHDDQWNRQC